MKRIALLFAGQGAQYPGMGKDVYQKHGFVREMFSEASAILGYDLAEMCFSENELLNQTENTQPAITAVNCSLYEVLKREGIIPTAALGFSLGEYSALYAAGVFSFPTVISLVKERARCMAAVARKRAERWLPSSDSVWRVSSLCRERFGHCQPQFTVPICDCGRRGRGKNCG